MLRATMKSLLFALLAAVVTAGPAHAFDPWADTARYQLVYEVELAGLPPGALELWLPAPRDVFDQHLIDLQVEAPLPHRETLDALGNRIIHLEGATPPPGSAPLVARFDVVREPGLGLPEGEVVKDSPDDPRRHLAPRRRIPLAGVIADLGRTVVANQTTDVEKTRALYDWVVGNMRYAKDGEGWGEGDAVWACDSKYGNCTDFHSVFLGMARSQGLPARFVMGFPIPPGRVAGEIAGYHCWAQAHNTGAGWIPLDASEAHKTGRHDDYFGRLPSDRVAFTHGRDLILEPPQQGEPLNFFVYPYVEIDGKAVETPPWKLRYERVPLRNRSGATPAPTPTGPPAG